MANMDLSLFKDLLVLIGRVLSHSFIKRDVIDMKTTDFERLSYHSDFVRQLAVVRIVHSLICLT